MNGTIKQKSSKPNPKQKANIFSKLVFLYIFPLMKKGIRHDLLENDLYQVQDNFKSSKLADELDAEWKIQKKRSFTKLMFKIYGIPYLIIGTSQIIPVIFSTLRPLLIARFIAFFVPYQKKLSKSDACTCAASLILINFLEGLYSQHYRLQVIGLAIRARSAVCSFIYRRVLEGAPRNIGSVDIGKIITSMTTDVASFQAVVVLLNTAIAGIIKMVILFIILYYKIGLPSLVLIIAIVMIIPMQYGFLHFASKMKLNVCKKTDERLGTVKECLSAIRLVKMYIWERFFENKIRNARKEELSLLFRINFVYLLNLSTLVLVEHFLIFLLIITQVWLGKNLAADTTFYVINASYAIGFFVNISVPYATFHCSKFKAALQRISAVIETLESGTEISTTDPKIQLILDKGLTIVSGNNGSGKSTLLHNLVEQYHTLEVPISYASQEPWLFPSTIRQNIIFVEKFDIKRYKEVLRVCALPYDLETFQSGDQTIVADRAINLSKGQRARINLARAIYRRCDVYFFDDIFTCLDASVAEFIYKECILKFLKNKTVVLISNCIQYCKYANSVVVMSNGVIKSHECQISNAVLENQQESQPEFTKEDCNDPRIEGNEDSKLLIPTENLENIYVEEKKSGRVEGSVYSSYIGNGGGYVFFLTIIIICILAEIIASYKSQYVSQWVNVQLAISKMKLQMNSTDNGKYNYLIKQSARMHYNHGGLVLGLSGAIYTYGLVVFILAKKASRRLHERMTSTIANARMTFFDQTFLGNILNRFSKDFQILDEQTPFVLFQMLKIFFEIFGIFVLIAMVNTLFLIPAIIFVLLLVLIRYLYLRPGRNLRRLDLSTRGPVIGHMNATLEGLTTIRAFKAEEVMKDEFDIHQDLYTSASFLYEICMRFFVLIIVFISSSFIAVVILRFLLIQSEVPILVGAVGLAISQAMRLVNKVEWGIQQSAELENEMTSIERVLEYTKLPTENRQGLELKSWPQLGCVTFENVSLAYSKTYVLKNINFTVESAEKLAIVGRTGAGKSSIVSSIFRLYDYQGQISINGIDIKTLSLDCLRSIVGVIPQDPTLFHGTIKSNLDPLERYTEEDLWNVLEIAQLKMHINNLSVAVSDLQFNVGQRQLLCLCGILLSRNRIVIFDEAVEDVDTETELIIRDIIDRFLGHCTIITIAHKLDFITHFDRVMVLDKGEIVELGTPSSLLAVENGTLCALFAKTKCA